MPRALVRTPAAAWLTVLLLVVPSGSLVADDESTSAPEEVARLGGGKDSSTGVGFDPEGRWVAVAGHDGLVQVWSIPAGDAKEPDSIATLDANGDALWSLAISPKGDYLAAGGDGVVRIWRTKDWKKERELQLAPGAFGEPFTVFSLSFSPDGRELVAGGMSKAIKRWKAPSWKPLKDLAGHLPPPREGGPKPADPTGFAGYEFVFVQFVAMDEKGRVVVTGGRTKSTRVWVRKGQKWKSVHAIDEPNSGANRTSGAVSPDGKSIVVGGSDGSLWWIDTKRGTARVEEKAHAAQVGGIVFGPKGRQVVTAGDTVKIWDVKTRKLVREIDPKESAWRVATSGDGEWLVVSFATGAPALYRLEAKLESTASMRRRSTEETSPACD